MIGRRTITLTVAIVSALLIISQTGNVWAVPTEEGVVECVKKCTEEIETKGRVQCVSPDDYLACLKSEADCKELAENSVEALHAACKACHDAFPQCQARRKSAGGGGSGHVEITPKAACFRQGGVWVEDVDQDKATGEIKQVAYCYTLLHAKKAIDALEKRVAALEKNPGGLTPEDRKLLKKLEGLPDSWADDYKKLVERFDKVEKALAALCSHTPEKYYGKDESLFGKCDGFGKWVEDLAKEDAAKKAAAKKPEADDEAEKGLHAEVSTDDIGKGGLFGRGTYFRISGVAGVHFMKLPVTDETVYYAGAEFAPGWPVTDSFMVSILGGLGMSGDVANDNRYTYWLGAGGYVQLGQKVRIGPEAIFQHYLLGNEFSVLNTYAVAPALHWTPMRDKDTKGSFALGVRFPLGLTRYAPTDNQVHEDFMAAAAILLGGEF